MTDSGLIPAVPPRVTFPVYGLIRYLYRLQCYQYTFGEGDRLLSCHRSSYYEQRVKDAGDEARILYQNSTFVVMLLAQSKGSEKEQAQLWDGIDCGLPHRNCLQEPLIAMPWNQSKSQLQEKQEVTIDGVSFVGLVRHYHTPAPFTYIAFGSLATSIRANLHGPSVEEVFEIFSALQVLHPNRERK